MVFLWAFYPPYVYGHGVSDVIAKPARHPRRSAKRGAMEISLPNGAQVSLNADVDAEALRRVLLRGLMLRFAPGVKVYPACKPRGHAAGL